MSFKAWRQKLGRAVPLSLAPTLMGRSAQQIAQAVRAGELPVFTFHADDGRTYRMARVADLKRLDRNPLLDGGPPPGVTREAMLSAFRKLTESEPRRRRTPRLPWVGTPRITEARAGADSTPRSTEKSTAQSNVKSESPSGAAASTSPRNSRSPSESELTPSSA